MNNYADHPPRCFNENRKTVKKALRLERRILSSFLHPQSALICWQIKSASVLCRDGNVKSDNFKISTMEATERNYFMYFTSVKLRRGKSKYAFKGKIIEL